MEMPTFNWVQARSECSLEHVFKILAEIVDSDVKAANNLKREGVKFELNTEAVGKLIVVRDRQFIGATSTAVIVFELLPDKIRVIERRKGNDPDAETMFFAVPYLNKEGECLLEVEGKPLTLWQVSRKALEGLFFLGS